MVNDEMISGIRQNTNQKHLEQATSVNICVHHHGTPSLWSLWQKIHTPVPSFLILESQAYLNRVKAEAPLPEKASHWHTEYKRWSQSSQRPTTGPPRKLWAGFPSNKQPGKSTQANTCFMILTLVKQKRMFNAFNATKIMQKHCVSYMFSVSQTTWGSQK